MAQKWLNLASAVEDASHASDAAMHGGWQGKAADVFHQRHRTVQQQAGDTAGSLRVGNSTVRVPPGLTQSENHRQADSGQ